MTWLILTVAALVLLLFIALIMGWVGGGMGSPTSSLAHEPLPDGELHDDDLARLHFDVGARGYRMSEVDAVIDRVRRELREKDEQIAQLRADSAPVARHTPDAAGPGPQTRPATSGGEQDGPAPSATERDAPQEVGGIEVEHPHHVNPAAVFAPDPADDDPADDDPADDDPADDDPAAQGPGRGRGVHPA